MQKNRQKKPNHKIDFAAAERIENRRSRSRSGSMRVAAIEVDADVWRSIKKPYALAVRRFAELVTKSQAASETKGERVKVLFGLEGARGILKVHVENKEARKKNDVDDFDAALAEARERGVSRVAEILAQPDMLSAADFAKFIGVSREAVRGKQQRREILGLKGAKRGARFPRWQVNSDGGLLPGLPRIFALLGGDSWTVYRFLTQHHPELEGESAVSALQSGDVEQVLEAAENTAGAFS